MCRSTSSQSFPDLPWCHFNKTPKTEHVTQPSNTALCSCIVTRDQLSIWELSICITELKRFFSQTCSLRVSDSTQLLPEPKRCARLSVLKCEQDSGRRAAGCVTLLCCLWKSIPALPPWLELLKNDLCFLQSSDGFRTEIHPVPLSVSHMKAGLMTVLMRLYHLKTDYCLWDLCALCCWTFVFC